MQDNLILSKRCQSKNQTPKIAQEIDVSILIGFLFCMRWDYRIIILIDKTQTKQQRYQNVYIINISQEITEDETCRWSQQWEWIAEFIIRIQEMRNDN